MRDSLKDILGLDVKLDIKHVTDFRNYKVSFEKAQKVLGYKPAHTIPDIVRDLVDNHSKFKDFDNPSYYNIETFKVVDGTLKRRGATDTDSADGRRRPAQGAATIS